MEYGELHPTRMDNSQGLLLYESRFGTGRILAGSHQRIQSDPSEFSAMVSCLAKGKVKNVRVRRDLAQEIDFITSESFGVSIPPRCIRCLGCKDCRFETQQLSRNEQEELAVIKRNLELNPVENKWTTTYPYKEDPSILPDNYDQAYAIMLRTEKRLTRNKEAAENYQREFDGFLERNVIREISEEEMKNYSGPTFYVNLHEVPKEDSSSTPWRLVVNSSLEYEGISLNSILMKGPSGLRDLYGIQLKFRKHIYALMCDIKKMYHSIYTTETEMHIRRILWRHCDKSKPPKTYGTLRVTFGDKSAGSIATTAVRETARIYSYIRSCYCQED
jgi:hypothetical protein